MSSPTDRFSRLEKIAVFLIVMGEERAREILAEMDLSTIEQINDAIGGLGEITAKEKASVMIEFGDFFYKDKPLASKLYEESHEESPGAAKKQASAQAKEPTANAPRAKKRSQAKPVAEQAAEEKTATAALEKMKQQADKIDWSKAGYDFGDGFKGLDERRR